MILTTIFLIFISFLIIFNLSHIFRYFHSWQLIEKLSGPTALPIIGNGYIFSFRQPHEILNILMKFMEDYDDVVKIWFLNIFNLLIMNLQDIAIVMQDTKHLSKSSEYDYVKPWLHEGLLLSDGKKWSQRRKILTPAFHFGSLEHYITIFDRVACVLVKKLSKQKFDAGNNSLELGNWIHLMSLDAICESAMGVSINAQTNADSEYVRAVKTISKVLHKRMFDIFYRFNFIYQFTRLAREEKKALKVLHGFTEKIIVQRREELLKSQTNANANSSESNNKDDEAVGCKRKMAFLDILLQSEIDGKPLSDLDIREEVDTFMFEGHDTTSSAMTFFFYCIAKNPECQRKCFEEIHSIFGDDKDMPVTYDKLNRMSYIELCIKETLRLFPSVPLLGRKMMKDTEINGKIIPAGTNVGISPLYLGRSEKLFPNATSFIPERFDVVTSAAKLNPYAYIPFSAGPRNCIGQKFAMFEIKTVAANVLRHFEVECVTMEEPQLIAELILHTSEPLKFKFKPRIY